MKIIKKILSLSLLAILVLLFIYYLNNNLADFKRIFSFSFNALNLCLIFIYVVFSVANAYTNSLLLDMLTSTLGVKLKPRESFGLAIVTRFYNYITPFRGGMAVRAIYLKKKHNFPYIDFLASLSAIYIIIFFISSLGGLTSMLVIWKNQGVFNPIMFIIFLIIFLFLLYVIIFSPRVKTSKNKWLNKLIKILNGWQLIKDNKKIIFYSFMISIIQILMSSISILILYSVFGITVSFFQALFISSVASLALLISITPGNLGVGEAINVFSAAIVGIGVTEALAVTISGKGITVMLILILGPIFSYFLFKDNKNRLES